MQYPSDDEDEDYADNPIFNERLKQGKQRVKFCVNKKVLTHFTLASFFIGYLLHWLKTAYES